MDFSFTEDQLALRDSMSRFLMTEAAPELLRDIWETDSGRSAVLRIKMAAQGLTALSVPEADGGLGLGDVDWALMTQELGYYAIPDSMADTAYVAVGVLTKLPAGHPVRSQWLPKVVQGGARIAVGHSVNPWVADAHMADLVLLPKRTPQGALQLHAVEGERLRLAPQNSIDASRRLAAVDWSATSESCFLTGDAAESAWNEALDRGAVNTAGQLVGLAQRMLDLSVDYVAQRKQFGKAIGSFQAVKHHLADVATKIEFAKPVLYRAAAALARGDAQRAALVSHAKLACADAAWTAGRKGIQVHGAMGYTWEVDLQMFMKRAWALDAAWGDRGFHKSRLADGLLGGASADQLLGPAATLLNGTHQHG